MTRIMVGAVAVWLTVAPTAVPAQESLEQALLTRAPELIAHFQKQQYQNVGVLKFLVHRAGEDKLRDNAGTLNLLLARRLEMALLLANDPTDPVGIIKDASAVAEKTPGASHLDKERRLKLFQPKYPLAWGNAQVPASAFVTGIAHISADLKTLTVSLLVFDREHNKVEPVLKDFTAANRAEHLAEMGVSFLLRGIFDDGKVEIGSPKDKQQQKILEQAAQVYEAKAAHPAKEANPPVLLEVNYDGRPVPPEVRDGKAFIPEPGEGQKVKLVLKHDGGKERYAVAVKVNGVNTLEKQRLPDLYCWKWVLYPGDGPLTIDGYTVGDRKIDFRVLSQAESKAKEVDYGAEVGMITMTVFREARGKEPVPGIDYTAAKIKVLEALPELPSKDNYGALKATLMDTINRGLIGEGDQHKTQVVQTVPFRPDPRPLMCLTVVYYKRQ
jgi:hypothetical protein